MTEKEPDRFNLTIEFTNGKIFNLNDVILDKDTSKDMLTVTKGPIVYFIRNSTNVNVLTLEKVAK